VVKLGCLAAADTQQAKEITNYALRFTSVTAQACSRGMNGWPANTLVSPSRAE